MSLKADSSPASRVPSSSEGVTEAHDRKRGRSSKVRAPSGRMPGMRQARLRLLLLNLGVVSTILAIMAVAVYAVEAHAIGQQVDATLTSWATHRSYEDFLPNGKDTSDEAQQPGGSNEPYVPSSPNVFSVVLDMRGAVVFDPSDVRLLGLPDAGAARPVLDGHVTGMFATVSRRGHEYRLYTVALSTNGRLAGALQAGTSLAAAEGQLHSLLAALGLVVAGMLLLTAAVSVYLTDRALVPLRLAFERQRQFSAGASHELRTPLAILRAQVDLVTRRLRRAAEMGNGLAPPDVQTLAEDVGEMSDETDYMARLVRDLLVLAQSTADAAGSMKDVVDLQAIVGEALVKVRPMAEQRGLQIAGPAEDAPSGLVTPVLVRGDADRLRQLTLILLENAIQYTPPGGRIVARAALRRVGLRVGRSDEALLTVQDTGAGIVERDLQRIFEPFYRAAHGVPEGETHSGAGLGLALARWIARMHGGEIHVASHPGEGSIFTVHLPLLSSSEDNGKSPPAGASVRA
jgi:two-component system sensor histidine kinase CiaH